MTMAYPAGLSETVQAITGRPMTPRALGLATLISAADSLAICVTLRTQISRSLRANSIRYTEGTILQSALTDQAAALFRTWQASHTGQSSENGGRHSDIDQQLTALPANRLYARLEARLPCHVVIDGHNLVFRLSALFRHLFDSGRPGSAAKGLLVERLLAQIAWAESLRITLWFDGTDPAIETPHPQLTVRYSGGTGPDRADREIVAYLKTQVPESLHPVFLVTDDVDEARRATKTGAQVIPCGEFRRMVASQE
jgi:hypothetical protein